MSEERNDVEQTAEESATDSSTENKPEENNSSTAEKPNEKPDEKSPRTIPYERFAEVNREAKLARKIKQRLGMDESQLEELLEKEEEEAPAAAPSTLNKRIAALEENIERTSSILSKQNEDREWQEVVVKNPDFAPFKDTVIELGRTGKYRDMPYSEIYKQVFAPVVKSGYSKAYSKQQEKELAQLHKGKSELPKDGDITAEEFKKLPLEKKKEYLKSVGII